MSMANIPAMTEEEIIIRSVLRLGHRSGTWDAAFTVDELLEYLKWLMRPLLGDPDAGRRVYCILASNGSLITMAQLADAMTEEAAINPQNIDPIEAMREALIVLAA